MDAAVGCTSTAAERPVKVMQSLATIGALVLLAGCGSPTVSSDSGSKARQVLLEHSEQGPVMAVVIGNPFAIDETRLDSIVTQAMSDGVTGVSADFTTDSGRATAAEPRSCNRPTTRWRDWAIS